MSELSEASKDMWRAWWAKKTPEDRAALRAMHGHSVTVTTNKLITDEYGGLPDVLVPVAETGTFWLPMFLLDEEDAADV